MKRNTILSILVAALLAAVSSSAVADVDVSLNVTPNDFSDLSQGGTWQLVAKTDTPDSDGIVGLTTRFIDGTIPAAGTVNPNVGHDIFGGTLLIGTFVDPNGPNYVEFVYGQDPNDGLVLGVGLPGGPSNVGPDPLGQPIWDDASEIAFGTIPDLNVIPVALLAAANEVFETIGGGIQSATIDQFIVRVAVPEPSTALLLLAGCCGAGLRRRR